MKRALRGSPWLPLLAILLLTAGCASLGGNPISRLAGQTTATPAVRVEPTPATTLPAASMTPAPPTETPVALAPAEPVLPPLPTMAGPEVTGLGPLELPVRVKIPRIGVDAPVETVGLEADGTMGTPKSFSDVGWYGYGPTPGQAGEAVLAGHVDSVHGPAIFWSLRDLKPGDRIEVDLFGGGARHFVVDGSGTYPSGAAPISSIFSWSGPPRLSVITCGGVFDRSVHAYDHRLIVYARLDSSL
ncbi:MAG: sortase domain-containing protein [Chloroflexota bacterium]